MAQHAAQRGVAAAGETVNVAINYTPRLDSGELLTGTPTITEVTTTDFTINNKAVSTGSLTILGDTVATGAAVQCSIAVDSGATLGEHEFKVTVSTDSTPAQVLVWQFYLDVV